MFGVDLSYADLTVTATADGSGTVITIPGQDGGDPVTITLQGFASSDVTADMFEFSNAGDDTIAGTAADEIITGGTGDDTLTGGGGSDTFVFAPGRRRRHDYRLQHGRRHDRPDRVRPRRVVRRPDHRRDHGRHGYRDHAAGG